jgi:hypothetical protein
MLKQLITAGALGLAAIPAQANSTATPAIATPEWSAIDSSLAVRKPMIVVKLHAMLSHAQFRCGYRFYNPAMIAMAAKAATLLSDETLQVTKADGMKAFDLGVAKNRGDMRRACDTLTQTFPAIVRP